MKVVINACFGGFGLSVQGERRYVELMGKTAYFYKQVGFKGAYVRLAPKDNGEGELLTYLFLEDMGAAFDEFPERDDSPYFYMRDVDRNDPLLIQVVEELGAAANGMCASLKVIEIPDGTDYEISEYDGNEHIAERHQTWA